MKTGDVGLTHFLNRRVMLGTLIIVVVKEEKC